MGRWGVVEEVLLEAERIWTHFVKVPAEERENACCGEPRGGV